MLSSICKDSHYILYIQVLIFFLFKFGMSLTCSIMYSLSGVMSLVASVAFAPASPDGRFASMQ